MAIDPFEQAGGPREGGGGALRVLVAGARVGVLATLSAGADGDGVRPHLVPCCFVLEGDTVWTAVDDVKPKASPALRRLDNVRERPVASLLVSHYDDEWSALWWVRLDGEASVVDAGDKGTAAASGLLAAKYRQYAEHPPPGPMIALRVTGVRSWSALNAGPGAT